MVGRLTQAYPTLSLPPVCLDGRVGRSAEMPAHKNQSGPVKSVRIWGMNGGPRSRVGVEMEMVCRRRSWRGFVNRPRPRMSVVSRNRQGGPTGGSYWRLGAVARITRLCERGAATRDLQLSGLSWRQCRGSMVHSRHKGLKGRNGSRSRSERGRGAWAWAWTKRLGGRGCGCGQEGEG